MKDEIMNRLAAVLNALNAVSVNGKQNLANLSGSIAVIEEVAAMLGDLLSKRLPQQMAKRKSKGGEPICPVITAHIRYRPLTS